MNHNQTDPTVVPSQDELIHFPERLRVRCPRCGADRQEPRPGQPGSYLCNSADHQQSASCARREELRGSENLLTDAWSILAKFRFAPVTELRVVE